MTKKLDLVSLHALAKVANQHHEKACSGAQSAVENAQLCGKALCQAKELIPHGGWLDWLSKNCPEICERTAQYWMKCSKYETIADLTSPKSLTQLFIAAGIRHEKSITVESTVTRESEEKAVADRYCAQLGIGTDETTKEPPAPLFPVEQSTPPFVSGFTVAPPSPPGELQDPIPGATGTGRSGGEDISNHPLGPLVKLVMDEITRLGEGHAVSNLLVLSPIFQYGRCHGQEGL